MKFSEFYSWFFLASKDFNCDALESTLHAHLKFRLFLAGNRLNATPEQAKKLRKKTAVEKTLKIFPGVRRFLQRRGS